MAKLEIEVGEDGRIGTLPEPLQKFFDSRIQEATARAYSRAADEAKRQVGDPVEREELRQLREFKQAQDVAGLERDKRYEEAIKKREEDYQAKRAELEASLAKRDQRLQKALGAEVRAAAIKSGAREESLPELEVLLGASLALDEELNAFVKDDHGKPLLKDGAPVSIEAYVASYLDSHLHHRKAPTGSGGGARGGASLSGADVSAAAARLEAAKTKIEHGDRSPATFAEFLAAEREFKKSA